MILLLIYFFSYKKQQNLISQEKKIIKNHLLLYKTYQNSFFAWCITRFYAWKRVSQRNNDFQNLNQPYNKLIALSLSYYLYNLITVTSSKKVWTEEHEFFGRFFPSTRSPMVLNLNLCACTSWCPPRLNIPHLSTKSPTSISPTTEFSHY